MRKLTLRQLPRRIGRRGIFLLLLGALWILMAASVIANSSQINPDDAIVYERLPVWLRIALWVGSGIVMIIAGLSPAKHQTWGFVIAAIMPFQRVVSGAWSVIAYFVPGPPTGRLTSIATFGIWSAILGIIWLVAGWHEDLFPQTKEE